MAQSGSASQMKFLKNSALYLSSKSPSTSAHLMSVHNKLNLEELKSLSASQHRESCGACGSIRLPGWTSSVSTRTKRKAGRKAGRQRTKPHNGPASSTSSSEVVYTCLRCHRQAVQTLPQKPPRPTTQRKARLQASTISTSTSTSSAPPKPETDQHAKTSTSTSKIGTENASSKKRAKARKQQGLMALLDKQRSQSQNSPSPSLDLLDFLQR